MTIVNLGSINIDHVHRVPHFPAPGETLADTGYAAGLGGKGLNQSLAAAAAGARVIHAGAVGAEGGWAVERLNASGIDTASVATVAQATGHAVILVDPAGENQIVIHAGANRAIPETAIRAALARARPGDWLLTQNETNGTVEAARAAKVLGLRVAHAAAPFDAAACAAMLPHADLIAVNEGEAAALSAHLGHAPAGVAMLVTLGARGARYQGAEGRAETPAFPVTPVDTTGAGDCFTGFFLAGIDTGLTVARALRRAAAAAAISVTRSGAADAIPTGAEVDRFLAAHAPEAP
ncbi:PfkB family carbohydrate kinase [Limibaculum sp. FT325]|uniref:PfkB family carbohydrate kinase n=1 Tax=Thermohalobaculum sediminis TaxID=2939436 RepID=UPI0020BF3FEF|nr:PfkB family carbohydrate kinase [Limibaculum sediminis]MCL5775949.1 PfkB family carbohydrate kinase [Limibaculum sediminis]